MRKSVEPGFLRFQKHTPEPVLASQIRMHSFPPPWPGRLRSSKITEPRESPMCRLRPVFDQGFISDDTTTTGVARCRASENKRCPRLYLSHQAKPKQIRGSVSVARRAVRHALLAQRSSTRPRHVTERAHKTKAIECWLCFGHPVLHLLPEPQPLRFVG